MFSDIDRELEFVYYIHNYVYRQISISVLFSLGQKKKCSQ
jgi:hypothetical protein